MEGFTFTLAVLVTPVSEVLALLFEHYAYLSRMVSSETQ